jgi:preprotein translocase subunit SecA
MVDFGAFSTRLGKGIQRMFGSQNERTLASFKPIVEKVNALEEWAKGLDEGQIKARVQEWREKVQAGSAKLDDALPEMFAMTRVASERTLGLRHFDVQLIGGANLHHLGDGHRRGQDPGRDPGGGAERDRRQGGLRRHRQ